MNRLLACIIATAVAWSAYGAETPAVVESFGCTLLPGKTLADFDKATAAWQSDMDKIPGGDEYFAVTLVPIRANTSIDIAWLGSYPNLNSWSKNTASYMASPEGKASDARFDKVASCETGLAFSEALHTGLPAPTVGGPAGVIEAYQCKLKHGKTMANVAQANAAWMKWVEDAKAADPSVDEFSAYMLQPWIADTPYDLVYLVVHSDLESFGSTNTELFTSDGGQVVGAGFDSVMSCESGLFQSNVVRTPAAADE